MSSIPTSDLKVDYTQIQAKATEINAKRLALVQIISDFRTLMTDVQGNFESPILESLISRYDTVVREKITPVIGQNSDSGEVGSSEIESFQTFLQQAAATYQAAEEKLQAKAAEVAMEGQ